MGLSSSKNNPPYCELHIKVNNGAFITGSSSNTTDVYLSPGDVVQFKTLFYGTTTYSSGSLSNTIGISIDLTNFTNITVNGYNWLPQNFSSSLSSIQTAEADNGNVEPYIYGTNAYAWSATDYFLQIGSVTYPVNLPTTIDNSGFIVIDNYVTIQATYNGDGLNEQVSSFGLYQAGAGILNANIGQSNIFQLLNAPSTCLHPNTLVKTVNGYKRIESICSNDIVVTENNEPLNLLYNIKNTTKTKKFIKIAKGALGGIVGDEKPMNDLLITNGHPLIINGQEIPCQDLINADTITRVVLDDYVTVYSLCSDKRVPVIMENVPVLIWKDNEWLQQANELNIGWSKANE